MVKAKKQMRFPVLVVLLLAGTFVFAFTAGAFIYATGSQVIMEARMVMVSHTEYRFSEAGQIIARITDFQGNPVVANCTATILYPNKTAYVVNATMLASPTSGDYYYNFTTPAGPEGVYEYQAVCTYQPGNKQASVTNSFHLSGALTSLLANQSAILGNLSQVHAEVGSVSANLSLLTTEVGAINASLASQITTVNNNLLAINTSLGSAITVVNGNVLSVNASVVAAQAALAAQMSANTTRILNAIYATNSTLYAALQNLTVNVNLTAVLTAINTLNATMASQFTNTNALISSVNASTTAQFSVVNGKLDALNVTAQSMTAALAEINATTQNTYTYLTGTLAMNVNNILGTLGVINATVNRIELLNLGMNSTLTTVLTNQQNAVNIQVFSG